MSITYIDGIVRRPGEEKPSVRFLVDSGATSSLVAKAIWKAIDLVHKREMTFPLEDGTSTERRVSECYLTRPQGDEHTPVIMGETGAEALLVVVTLEILNLVFNPFSRTLHPMRMVLS